MPWAPAVERWLQPWLPMDHGNQHGDPLGDPLGDHPGSRPFASDEYEQTERRRTLPVQRLDLTVPTRWPRASVPRLVLPLPEADPEQ